MMEYREDIAYVMIEKDTHEMGFSGRIALCPQDVLDEHFLGCFKTFKRFAFADLYQGGLFTRLFLDSPISKYGTKEGYVGCIELKGIIPTGSLLDATEYAVGLKDTLHDFETEPVILGVQEKGSSGIICLERDDLEMSFQEIREVLKEV